MTQERTNFLYVTFIRTTPEKVFEALTRPELTRRYWGHDNVSEWKVGAPWAHVRDNPERTVNIVGEVVECAPPRRLVVSWTGASSVDDPVSYSRVTYELEPYDGMVRLTVSHEDLLVGSAMEQGVRRGWPIVLSSLKSFLETGESIDIFAKPLASLAGAA